MTIVILGASRVGVQLAKQLVNEHKEVIIIEKDQKRAQDVSRQLDCLTINDNGNSIETLEKAGVENADFFIGVTESDEINMISCALVSSSFSKPVTIARVRNVDYSRTWDKQPEFLGIKHIVNPEVEVAHAIVRAVEYGAMSSVIDFETSNLQMRSIHVEQNSTLEGYTLKALRKAITVPFIVAVISRGAEMIIPSGDTQLEKDDQIWLIADQDDFAHILNAVNKEQEYIKDIALAGGGNIGTYIAQHLIGSNNKQRNFITRILKRFMNVAKRNVHIIEHDYDRCKELAEILPEAQVTHANISEEEVLEEGRFSAYDLLITATGNQDLNIVTAAHAKNIGVPRTLALVKKSSTASVARSLGVDTVISINETLVSSIQRIIRKRFTRSVYNFNDSNLEILEFAVNSKTEYSGKKIKDIKLPGNSIILMITRDGKHIIPNGEIEILADDYLMLLTTKDTIRELE